MRRVVGRVVEELVGENGVEDGIAGGVVREDESRNSRRHRSLSRWVVF